MHLYNISYICIACVHSSFLFFFVVVVVALFCFCFESGIDKSTEWSTIPACPSLMCFFFNSGDTEGTNSSKKLCLTFVCVLFYVHLCQD